MEGEGAGLAWRVRAQGAGRRTQGPWPLGEMGLPSPASPAGRVLRIAVKLSLVGQELVAIYRDVAFFAHWG